MNSLRRFFQNFGSLVATTLMLVLTFAGIGFVALSVVTGSSLRSTSGGDIELPTPRPAEAVTYIGTPDPSAKIAFKDAALGFALEYPRDWQINERGLSVVFSPSMGGLDPTDLTDASIWIGIPADNTVEPANLLTHLQYTLAPNSTTVNRGTVLVGDRVWRSTAFRFEDEDLGGAVTAQVAATTKDEVGYYVVSLAPSGDWATQQPFFDQILDSFEFTAEAVLRPTDATPPPTPTATPTPVVHIVQSGDTLGYIASIYGVTVEALSVRNGIDDPRSLQVGNRLIIPIKR